MNFLKPALIAIWATFSVGLPASASDAAGESEKLREARSYFSSFKPGGLNAGVELGMYRGGTTAFGVSAELDGEDLVDLVDGGIFVGPFARRYFGNSFYAQTGLGYGLRIEWNAEMRGLASHSLVGNEWQFDSGFYMGADWGGVSMAYFPEQSVVSGTNTEKRSGTFMIMPAWPRLRLGFAF